MLTFTRPRRLRFTVASLFLIGLVWVTTRSPGEVSISVDKAKETFQEAYKSVSSQAFDSHWGTDNEDHGYDTERNDDSNALNGESGELVDTKADDEAESFNDAAAENKDSFKEIGELELVDEEAVVAVEPEQLSDDDIAVQLTHGSGVSDDSADGSLLESQFDSEDAQAREGSTGVLMTFDTKPEEIGEDVQEEENQKEVGKEEDKVQGTSSLKKTLKGSNADIEPKEDGDSGSSKATYKKSNAGSNEKQKVDTRSSQSSSKSSKGSKGSVSVSEEDAEENEAEGKTNPASTRSLNGSSSKSEEEQEKAFDTSKWGPIGLEQ